LTGLTLSLLSQLICLKPVGYSPVNVNFLLLLSFPVLTMRKRNLPPNYLFIVIFLAGFSFLVYEISWFRMLSFTLGSTVKASTIVLCAFMAGFGVGAWYWGKLSVRNARYFSVVTSLLIAIGAMGIFNYFLLNSILPGLYAPLAKVGLSPGLAGFVVTILSLILLFIPAFFMGGIFPLVSGLLVKSNSGLASMVGRIYAWETAGSALGGLATGFVFIRFLGQQNTVFLSVAMNALSILPLLYYQYKSVPYKSVAQADNNQKHIPVKETRARESSVIATQNHNTAILATFFFGFTVIGLQVAWFRIFRVYLTNTSYTFSLIASVVILGFFAGSRYFSARGKDNANSRTLLHLLLLTAIAIVIGFAILVKLPSLILFPLAGDQDAYFMRIILIPVISALLVILPVTFLSGYAFPLACSLYTADYHVVSSSIGRIMLYNTAGNVAGPLVAAFVLIPLVGAGFTVLFFAMVLFIVSFFLLQKNILPQKRILRYATAGFAALIFLMMIISPRTQILPPSFIRFDREIIEYHETTEGTLVVGRDPRGKGSALSTYVNNSAVIGSSYDAVKVVKMVGHLPFFAGLKCKNALVVGFGIGVTTSAIASHPEVESIECIELVEGLRKLAHYYSGINNNIQDEPRVKVISGDGRQYLQSADKKYDLISSDPTHPILGSGSLYTKEYFELCKSRLNPGGMVSQYLPLHKLLPADFQGIIKTFQQVFPFATVWLGHNHAVLLGSSHSILLDFKKWSEAIADSEQDPYFYTNPYHMAACLVLDGAAIEKFPASIKINTDNRPLTEFFSLSSFESQNLILNLSFLNSNRNAVNRIFTHIPDQAMMQRFINGNVIFTNGLIQELNGNRRALIEKLGEAATENPEDEEYPFLIRFYSGMKAE